ncbi:hypothetical protein GCM10007424_03520 [Flavobacterium suaedae]|uniref:Uncharacterized protein n=1 Tax=Flavobacterium suaedae TaxID=1767027 RepID=A0ABQ1JEE0_9FLAO|nr:hypothetical protein GCM10007424_03520 [Flavobacterium suaedae]
MNNKILPIILIIIFAIFLSFDNEIVFYLQAIIVIFMVTMSIIKLKRLYTINKIDKFIFGATLIVLVFLTITILYFLYKKYLK